MGEKFYKPVVKDGDHLIRSKDNPDRVRGLTRDENNQNPDIIEWEEYDIDDLVSNDYVPYSCEDQHVQLTPEQEERAQFIAEVLSDLIITTGTAIFQNVVSPWWENKAWPWVKKKGHDIKDIFTGEPKYKTLMNKKSQESVQCAETVVDQRFTEVSSKIDEVFEQYFFDMDEEEVKTHMMRLIYHMLGMVNEIRIISNARISKECKSEKLRLEKTNEVEKFLSGKVANCLDQFLSNDSLKLDLNTSRELFFLTGGGVRLNGEYVPVQSMKIEDALKAIPIE